MNAGQRPASRDPMRGGMLFLRRRQPTADELIDASLARGDYRSAAIFIVAGAAATLHEATELGALDADTKQLQLALQLAPQTVRASG